MNIFIDTCAKLNQCCQSVEHAFSTRWRLIIFLPQQLKYGLCRPFLVIWLLECDHLFKSYKEIIFTTFCWKCNRGLFWGNPFISKKNIYPSLLCSVKPPRYKLLSRPSFDLQYTIYITYFTISSQLCHQQLKHRQDHTAHGNFSYEWKSVWKVVHQEIICAPMSCQVKQYKLINEGLLVLLRSDNWIKMCQTSSVQQEPKH